jgi:O-acetyl-ADP-ribose deacetylase (regulator of RNase III)
MKYGFGELDFFLGDIWEIATQAFITPITTDLRPKSGIGANVVRRAGPQVLKELSGYNPVGLGQTVVTSAGSLRAKQLIHVSISTLASRPTGEILKEAMREALAVSRHLNFHSVAIPAMAIEPGELTVKIVGNIMVNACFGSLKISRTPERFVLVVPSAYVENEFKKIIEDRLELE